MSHSKPINPKRKRRVYAAKEPPFPVPIATLTNEAASSSQWFYYTGYLHGDHVVVKHSGDIDFLYKMGFFGKGTMSRSKPEFNKRCRTAQVPDDSGFTVPARLMSRRSYLRRLKWSNTEGTEGDEYDSSQEIIVERADELASKDLHRENTQHDTMERNVQEEKSTNKSTMSEEEMEESDWLGIPGGGNSAEKSAVDDWGTGTGDTEFWGDTSAVDSWEKDEGDVDFWNSTETKPKTDLKEEDMSITESPHVESKKNAEKPSHGIAKDGNEQKENYMEVDKDLGLDSTELNSRTEEFLNIKCANGNKSENFNSVCFQKSTANSTTNMSSNTENVKDATRNIKEGYEENSNESEHTVDPINLINEEKPSSLKDNESDWCRSEENNDHCNERSSDGTYDPRSFEEEECGSLLVVDDSDSESETKKRKFSELPWKPVKKIDPYFMKENLHLSYEEAFFLAYGLGSLIVYGENQEKLLLSGMWKIFCQRRKNFVPKYVAYHYYRSKGWVPKSGLKFGSDFVIYKEGPAFYHSSYSVIVRMVDSETLMTCTGYPQRDLDWTTLSGLNRVTEHVAKELLICYVLKPSCLSEEEILSPSCISKFKVKEHVVTRWVSSQEREHKQVEDMP